MMQSGRAALATSGRISGSGFASARMIGLSAIVLTISPVSTPAVEQPRNTSALLTMSASVRLAVSCA
ncbi:hypothetical protein D3C81_1863880 [compost metagenome]